MRDGGTSTELINERLLSFLFEYRNSVHCSTNETPAKLMLGRELRTKLDLILPSSSVAAPDSEVITLSGSRKFNIGQTVWVRCFIAQKPVWRVGVILNKNGNRMFTVDVKDVGTCVRHVDQLLRYSGQSHIDDAVRVPAQPPAAPPPPPRAQSTAPGPAEIPAPLSPERPRQPASVTTRSSPGLTSLSDANANKNNNTELQDVASDNDFYECVDQDVGGGEAVRAVPSPHEGRSPLASAGRTEPPAAQRPARNRSNSGPSPPVLRPRTRRVNYK